ncbi:aspartate ammonia-lyase [Aquisediminimonas sediminicola]|uniref:aspartate ammonia-lyase n=1 Tax=Alteraquisediminimonas sediminicola TaxID=2676787 RepID=UPI001C8DBA3D|nr:aspartate ammonia-lyase [Aquisediminimonas sediminicola]
MTQIEMGAAYRMDSDPLGEVRVPVDSLYGAQAERARLNFPLTGATIAAMPELLVALAQVKKAAALVNQEIGDLPQDKAEVIIRACDEIIAGQHREQFIVDVCQGGAGTSTNMNANEVIANRALQLMGLAPGMREVIHPNDHVNRNQSTNDAYATAVRLSVIAVNERLILALGRLADAMDERADAFRDIRKLGRTQMQDAVPMTLGEEFGAFATTLREDAQRAQEIARLFLEVNLGGTAIGTGVAALEDYRLKICDRLADVTGLKVERAANLIEATWDMGAFVLYSGMLKRVASKLSKIANDLRLLSSGPSGGIGEIALPRRQPGSSIMPGKVNPVIPEAINGIAFRVFGLDLTVTFAAEAGQLQLNAFEPIICWSIHEAAQLLVHGMDMLVDHCVTGIEALEPRCHANLMHSTALATELVPLIGYARAARVAADAQQRGDLLAAVRALEPEFEDFIQQQITLTDDGTDL